jgi:hypothetical protein
MEVILVSNSTHYRNVDEEACLLEQTVLAQSYLQLSRTNAILFNVAISWETRTDIPEGDCPVLKVWYQPTNLDLSLTGVSGDGSVRRTQIVLNVRRPSNLSQPAFFRPFSSSIQGAHVLALSLNPQILLSQGRAEVGEER